MVITVVVCIVIVRWCRSNKQPFYDYVTPSQPPQLPERMEVKENLSYGRLLKDTQQSVSSQPAAYEVPQVSELQDNTVELKENASYGHLLANTPQSVSIPPLQPNVAYGAIQVSTQPGLQDAMNDSQSTCPNTTENTQPL